MRVERSARLLVGALAAWIGIATSACNVAGADGFTVCFDDVSVKGTRKPYVPDTGPALRVNQLGYVVRRHRVVLDERGGHQLELRPRLDGGVALGSRGVTPDR